MGNDGGPEERLLTKGEVAQLCRVEIRTVDRWVAAAKIKCYRTPSGRLLFQKRDVLMVIDRCQETVRSSGAPRRKVSSSDRTDSSLRR
jgi:predicted site-specific integrase-resolvase